MAFPVDLALVDDDPNDPGQGQHLIVLNQNFDLKYNSGTLQSYDLDQLGAPADCEASTLQQCQVRRDGNEGDTKEALCDGVVPSCCCFFNPVPASTQLVSSYSTDLEFSTTLERLYVAKRTQAALAFVGYDRESGTFQTEQGQAGEVPSGPIDGSDDMAFGFEPERLLVGRFEDIDEDVSLPAGYDGADYILVGHTSGQLTLMVQRRAAGGELQGPPVPISSLGPAANFDARRNLGVLSLGVDTSGTPSGGDPVHKVYVAGPESVLERVFLIDGEGAGAPPQLAFGGQLSLIGRSEAGDNRDFAFDGDGRVYILSENDRSVQVGEVDPTELGGARYLGATPLDRGSAPARMTFAEIMERDYLFISSFDGRQLWILDVLSQNIVAVLRGFSGPFETVVEPDADFPRMYVADWRSSVVRVVDLRGLGDASAPLPHIFATIGRPRIEEGFN